MARGLLGGGFQIGQRGFQPGFEFAQGAAAGAFEFMIFGLEMLKMLVRLSQFLFADEFAVDGDAPGFGLEQIQMGFMLFNLRFQFFPERVNQAHNISNLPLTIQ